jgi:hypothetical protein
VEACYFLFSSITYAMKAKNRLEASSIRAVIIRPPKQIPCSSCSYCVKINEKNYDRAYEVLKHEGIKVVSAFSERD